VKGRRGASDATREHEAAGLGLTTDQLEHGVQRDRHDDWRQLPWTRDATGDGRRAAAEMETWPHELWEAVVMTARQCGVEV
jgi:hypothetical protein